jgi:hypothetical protein
VERTHQATRRPTSVSHTLSCTLLLLPVQLWVPSTPHRPCWTGNMTAGSTLQWLTYSVASQRYNVGVTTSTSTCTSFNPVLSFAWSLPPLHLQIYCHITLMCQILYLSCSCFLFYYVILCTLWGFQWHKFIGISSYLPTPYSHSPVTLIFDT